MVDSTNIPQKQFPCDFFDLITALNKKFSPEPASLLWFFVKAPQGGSMPERYFARFLVASLLLPVVACWEPITAPTDVSAPTLVEEPCVAPGAGLISWWAGDGTFEDIAGPLDAANNIGFNSANGLRTAQLDNGDVTFESGLVGQAFSFTPITGSWEGEFIEIPDAVDLRPPEFTIDLWARRTGDGQNADDKDAFGNVLIQKAVNDRMDEGISYSIWWNGAGIIKAGVNLGGVLSRLENGVASVADEWVHIALTLDGSTLRLYVNGAEVDQDLDASGALEYGEGSVVIGGTAEFARSAGFPRGFHGLIDEVDLFGRALSADEVRDIYDSGAHGKCKAGEPDREPANAAPSVGQIEGGSIDEGETFERAVSFTDDDSESWSATVDYGDDDGDDFAEVGTSFDFSHSYAQNGEYSLTVTVTDDAGATSSSSATFVVNNVAPSVDAGPGGVFDGGVFEYSGSFADPGADEWTATVDWGDGSPVEPLTLDGMTFDLSHTFAGGGPYTLKVTVTDSDGGSGVGTAEVRCDVSCDG